MKRKKEHVTESLEELYKLQVHSVEVLVGGVCVACSPPTLQRRAC